MHVSNITANWAGCGSARRLVIALLERLDRWAFADQDARARAQGWQVRRPALFIRVYRNPKFDAFVTCTACEGEGVTSRGHCRGCLGSGRVRPF
jgi:hypothetical protein